MIFILPVINILFVSNENIISYATKQANYHNLALKKRSLSNNIFDKKIYKSVKIVFMLQYIYVYNSQKQSITTLKVLNILFYQSSIYLNQENVLIFFAVRPLKLDFERRLNSLGDTLLLRCKEFFIRPLWARFYFSCTNVNYLNVFLCF